MATAKITLLNTKRPGKDSNDPLFSDILTWTNDNASDLISGFFLQATDWTKGQIDNAINDLPGDIEHPQTARQYLRASLSAKPLVSVAATTPKTSRWVEIRSPNAVIWLRAASLLQSILCSATRED